MTNRVERSVTAIDHRFVMCIQNGCRRFPIARENATISVVGVTETDRVAHFMTGESSPLKVCVIDIPLVPVVP
jgi:hypothetical protein